MEITYRDVFGANPGELIEERHGTNWRPCPAVVSIRSLLGAHHVFPSIGGNGPFRRGSRTEFNRHHAGLAADIMIPPSNTSLVALGQHLVKLFIEHKNIMRWRGLIYQHISLTFTGNPTGDFNKFNWGADDHMNHIHIDWHSSANVSWAENITTIPCRLVNGTEIELRSIQGNRIASSIRWTAQAETNFQHDATLSAAIDSLMERHRAGQLTSVDLPREIGLVR